MVALAGRHQFSLPEDDVEFLLARNWQWEAITEGSTQWLLIHEFVIPAGYNVTSATVAIQIIQGYPTAALDMVYFRPDLSLNSGRAIKALSPHTIAGEVYQRWSRHRTAENPWRAGLDCIHTHIGLVEEWLLKEASSG
jgi:hypothetical protein